MSIDRYNNETKKSDLLYFRRGWSQSKVVLQTKETKNGGRKTTATINSEKISDAARFLLQNGRDFSDFKYDRLVEKAKKELAQTFKILGFDEGISKTKQKENEKKKRIAISNWIEKYIENNFPNKIEIDYDTFMKNVNIAKAKRSVTNGLQILFDAQNSSIYELEHPVVNLKNGEIEINKSRVAALPEISLRFDESIGGKYPTIMDFAKANIKNKKKLIKSLILKFSPQYLYYVLSIGNDYVTSYKSRRDKLKHTYSHKLDIFLVSLEGIQHNLSLVTITIDELKDMLGVDRNKQYKDFKRDVLVKAINDIENYMNKKIDYVEIKKSRRVIALRFSIRRNEDDPTFEFFYDYITSQLHYYSKYIVKNPARFKNFLKNTEIKNNEILGEEKTFEQWKSEAEEAFKAEQQIIEMFEDNKLFYDANNIIYSKKHHSLLNKVYLDEYDEKTEQQKIKFTFVKDNGVTVSNPVQALKYLRDMELARMQNSVHIIDLLPFAYFDRLLAKWINIDDIDTLRLHENKIQKDILLKDVSKFNFDDEARYAAFKYYVEAQKIADTSQSLRKKIQKSLFSI